MNTKAFSVVKNNNRDW